MNINTTLKKHRKTFFAIMFAFIACVIYGIVIYFLYTEKESVRFLMEKTLTEEARWHNARMVARQIEETGAEREYLRGLILKDRDVIKTITDFEDIARATSVSLSMKSIGVEEKDEHSAFLSMHIMIRGSREHVLRFITILADIPYALSFTHVSMDVSDEGVWEGDVECIIRNFKEQ
ncbi:MAG: hypothetical protein HGA48_01910 [Candidatus Yonathbacteria bacterium]|nr:hypothetical protein [Candidatus Yonathbacteria bacterium]